LIAIFGATLGILLATMIFKAIDLSLYLPNFQSFTPTPETLITAFLLAVLIGVSSVILSAYRVSGLTIADALRSTE
jgi:ABC-type antimicrobial peptide transport system permease subunit